MNINGDVNVTKQFIGCGDYARSGFGSAQDSQSEQGGDLGVNATTQTGSLGVSSGAALVSSLAAIDECGKAEARQAEQLPERRNDFEPPPVTRPEDEELEPAVR